MVKGIRHHQPSYRPTASTGADATEEKRNRVVTLWVRERGGLLKVGHKTMASAQNPHSEVRLIGLKEKLIRLNDQNPHPLVVHTSIVSRLPPTQVTCNNWASSVPVLANTGIHNWADIGNPERHHWPVSHPVIRMHSQSALATLRAGIGLMLVCRNPNAT